MTDRSHLYFTGPQPLGRMYGFDVHFSVRRVEWVVPHDAFAATDWLTLHQRIRRFNFRRKGQLSHLLWEFECSRMG